MELDLENFQVEACLPELWRERPDDSGKISEALWITSRYAEEIECDLQRYYGLDYRDLFLRDTRLTWRRLLVLLRHLPPEST